jgi:hypothetical protein
LWSPGNRPLDNLPRLRQIALLINGLQPVQV